MNAAAAAPAPAQPTKQRQSVVQILIFWKRVLKQTDKQTDMEGVLFTFCFVCGIYNAHPSLTFSLLVLAFHDSILGQSECEARGTFLLGHYQAVLNLSDPALQYM